MTEKEIERKRQSDPEFAKQLDRAEEISTSGEEIYSRRKEKRIATLAVFSACFVIAFYFIIDRWNGVNTFLTLIGRVITPFVIAFILAFFINPIMKPLDAFFTKVLSRISKNEAKTKKTSRLISTILALVIFVGIISSFFIIIIPDITSTVGYISEHIGDTAQNSLDWADDVTRGLFTAQIDMLRDGGLEELMSEIYKWLTENTIKNNMFDTTTTSTIFAGFSKIVTGMVTVIRTLIYFIIGIIVSVYLVQDKEKFKAQSKKILYAVCPLDTANTVMAVTRKTKELFYGFIIGKIIDSIIIGILCYILMLILKLPYPVLVSVIIGVTNVIPVFGPYFGAIPSVIIIFLTDPMKGIVFLVMVLALQQVDGNIIGPKILGESTGLSAFWVVVAIVVGGGLFGIAGMVVGVPFTALIYWGIGVITGTLLKKKNLPTTTSEYDNLERINVDGQVEYIDYEERQKNQPKYKQDLLARFKKAKKDKS